MFVWLVTLVCSSCLKLASVLKIIQWQVLPLRYESVKRSQMLGYFIMACSDQLPSQLFHLPRKLRHLPDAHFIMLLQLHTHTGFFMQHVHYRMSLSSQPAQRLLSGCYSLASCTLIPKVSSVSSYGEVQGAVMHMCDLFSSSVDSVSSWQSALE